MSSGQEERAALALMKESGGALDIHTAQKYARAALAAARSVRCPDDEHDCQPVGSPGSGYPKCTICGAEFAVD